jgi:hypothetical protein
VKPSRSQCLVSRHVPDDRPYFFLGETMFNENWRKNG